jgi:uncharacterized membrane-anchored protein YjiN (DUF445 family)
VEFSQGQAHPHLDRLHHQDKHRHLELILKDTHLWTSNYLTTLLQGQINKWDQEEIFRLTTLQIEEDLDNR